MNIFEKLTNLQTELKAPKSQYNKFGDYYYRNCEDILEAVKPLLIKYKLTQFIADSVEQISDRFYIKATINLVNAEKPEETITVSAYARETLEKKKMDDSQITGATSSYARKYALNGLYAIDDTKDEDTNERHIEINNRARSETSKKDRLATDDEIAQIFEVAEKGNIDTDKLKEILKSETGKEVTKGISIMQVNSILKKIREITK